MAFNYAQLIPSYRRTIIDTHKPEENAFLKCARELLLRKDYEAILSSQKIFKEFVKKICTFSSRPHVNPLSLRFERDKSIELCRTRMLSALIENKVDPENQEKWFIQAVDDKLHVTYKPKQGVGPHYKIPRLPLKPFAKSPQAFSPNQFHGMPDFTLTDKDHTPIHTYRALLLTGQDAVCRGISLEMKETQTGTMHFPDFRASTLNAYLVALFSGGEELLDELLKGEWEELDIMELLEFAHRHDNSDLLNCCINYLSIHSSRKDLEAIREAAERYELHPLVQLSRAIAPPQYQLILPEIVEKAKEIQHRKHRATLEDDGTLWGSLPSCASLTHERI